MAGLVELSSDLCSHGWGIVLPKCQGKKEWGSWISALYEQWVWQTNSIKEYGISSSLISLSVGERKHRKQPKARHTCIPVRLYCYVFVSENELEVLSLDTDQLFILSSSPSPSLFLILGLSLFSPLLLLAPFGSKLDLSPSLFTSPLSLISLCLIFWSIVFQTSGLCSTQWYKVYFYIRRQPLMPQKCTAPKRTLQQATGAVTACNPKANTHMQNTHTNTHISQCESSQQPHSVHLEWIHVCHKNNNNSVPQDSSPLLLTNNRVMMVQW